MSDKSILMDAEKKLNHWRASGFWVADISPKMMSDYGKDCIRAFCDEVKKRAAENVRNGFGLHCATFDAFKEVHKILSL